MERDWAAESRVYQSDLLPFVKEQKRMQAGLLGLGIGGGAMLVTGIILYRLGLTRRNRALETVPRPMTVAPLLGPGTAGLTLQGSF